MPAESLAQLKELSQFVDETANLRPNPRLPWVGAAAFSHKGGTHVNAVQKVLRSYEHIDPALGRQQPARADQRSRRPQQHRDEGARARLRRRQRHAAAAATCWRAIKELEHRGYEFEAADGSLALLIRRALTSGAAAVHRRRLSRVDAPRRRTPRSAKRRSRSGSATTPRTRSPKATARSTRSTPRCARRWSGSIRSSRSVRLTDYKVRIIDSTSGTAATTRVLIESSDGASSGARSASTTTSSKPACRRWSTASSTVC